MSIVEPPFVVLVEECDTVDSIVVVLAIKEVSAMDEYVVSGVRYGGDGGEHSGGGSCGFCGGMGFSGFDFGSYVDRRSGSVGGFRDNRGGVDRFLGDCGGYRFGGDCAGGDGGVGGDWCPRRRRRC